MKCICGWKLPLHVSVITPLTPNHNPSDVTDSVDGDVSSIQLECPECHRLNTTTGILEVGEPKGSKTLMILGRVE